MAVQNDPRLYSAGAVTFDATPSTNLYAQLMAKRQAKDEAIDEYYKKLPNTLNSAGMRDQDRQGLDEGLAKAQQYWMANKDKIRKGNTPEAFNYEQIFRELGTGVNNSKNDAKSDLFLGKDRFEGKNSHIWDDPDFLESHRLHTLPVWDKNHKSIDLGTVTLPTAPFDQEQQDKMWASVTKGVTPGKKYDYSKQYKNPQTGQVIVPFAKTFDPEQVEKIADQASSLIKDNKSARAYYNKMLNNPERAAIDELQKAYNTVYKGMVDTPEKAAAADAIIRASVPQEVGEEQEINYAQKQADKQININLNQGRGSGSGSGGSGGTIDGNEFDRIPIPKKTWLNKGDRVKPEDIPSSTKAILKTAGIDIEGMEYFMIDVNDGQVQSITPYWKDKDGKVHKEGVITRTDMENAQLRYNSEPQKGKQPNFGEQNRTPKSNNKPTYRGLDKNGNPIFK